ncbi:hypothetical protein WA026_015520 [Henosepilachna vigintioctopunctata]|uniref:Methyltransferase type 12 domain-containing protein n=1 Tax=Henosepilachna vigintioctopunctata TaxID=420089 RepID=A0AAW1V8A9_9CUCU
MSISPIKYISLMKYHLEYVPDILKQYSKVFTWKQKENIRIVDIGSGPGNLLAKVEPHFPQQYKEIIALDKEVDMVNYFNAVPKDPRISARQLDIEISEMPDDLKHRFDFAFSCLCFQYTKDVSKAFRNSSQLLNKHGESLFIWCKRCHMYDIYNSLSKVEKWSTYTNDFKNWNNYFDTDNALSIVEKEFDKVGLEILKSEDLNDIYFEEENAECFFDLLNTIDAISGRIPKYDLQKYKEDFNKALFSQIIVENTKSGVKHKLHFPTLVVASRKNL